MHTYWVMWRMNVNDAISLSCHRVTVVHFQNIHCQNLHLGVNLLSINLFLTIRIILFAMLSIILPQLYLFFYIDTQFKVCN